MKGLRFEAATPADALTVHRLATELAHEDGGADDLLATAADWERLLGRPDVLVVLARHPDGRPLGYVSATRRLNLWQGREIVAIDDVYVRAEGRNLGVGRRMMRSFAEVAAEGAPGSPPMIRWELRVDNHAAARFYARLGARLRTKQIAVWAPADYLAAPVADEL
jgi:ribosomal protein S18 acetylase RimI-like enzyme